LPTVSSSLSTEDEKRYGKRLGSFNFNVPLTGLETLSCYNLCDLAFSGIFLTTCCQEIEVSGVGCQGKEMLDTET
jgi:hypothetical protein